MLVLNFDLVAVVVKVFGIGFNVRYCLCFFPRYFVINWCFQFFFKDVDFVLKSSFPIFVAGLS